MDTTYYYTFIIIILCLIIVIITAFLLYIIFRYRKGNNKIDKDKYNDKINILSNKNNRLNQLNELQYKAILEYKVYLSSLIAPFKQLLEQKCLSIELNKQIQIANRSTLGIQNISFMLENFYKINSQNDSLKISKYKSNILSNIIINYFNQLLNAYSIKLFVFKDKEDNDIWIDYDKISLVSKILISNAYKHINYSGTIWVSIKSTEINNKMYCILSITDDGYCNDDIKEFNSFLNENDLINSIDNNQMFGIALVTKLIKLHDGNIKINLNAEGFKEYSIYIPLGEKHWEQRTDVKLINPAKIENNPINEYANNIDIEKDSDENSKKHIDKVIDFEDKNRRKLLIIEDHRDIQLYLKIIFEKEYDITFADNGKDGLDKAIEIIPSIIICDVMMPIMNGFECCKLLKNNVKTCYIPIVLLTALVEEEDIVKGLKIGVEDYIIKPFNPKILKTKIDNIVLQRLKLRRSYTNDISSDHISNNKNIESEKHDPLIDKITDIIEQNIHNPDFGVKMLSEQLNMSQPTLYRKIKQITNFTTIELIVGVRLKVSAGLLKDGKHNVQEVAELVGYNDISTFRKHFIDFYGITPSIYCKKNSPT